ncbi:MAG: polymer-forming cytoskeletal protein [Gammaproteobacteria bacterium]|jgi:cytoskeletal protein CcmA (bactofilin family)|nr:polymer-forming cytoskeletal protein [Gammaproteobacteria bacterium]MBU0770502.1 polymer-forming cytoskeletal protein [Gammaproteobacteria bacterium]MBU1846006.1 polymer-forming cytoskeletal protein [Gammaproteobacteria bacterium]
MFNKPALFPKTAESPASRTIRPSGSLSGSPGATVRGGDAAGALSPLRDSAPPGAPAAPGTTPADGTRRPEMPEHGSRLIVGPDVKLKGAEILDCDTLVVEGRVEATMDSRVIRIAEHGAYSGTVGIDVAEIHGRFDGELTARQQLIVHATGRVSGKIRYGKILIEEGGEISGDVKSLSGAGKDTLRPATGSADEPKALTALAG